MKRLKIALAALLVLPMCIAAQEPEPKNGRVRAKEPTVVTVEGRADQVEPARAPQRRSVGRRIGSVFTSTWNGVVSAAGWLLDSKDDIPSERERRERNKPER
jgi:hypothetical protein